MYFGRSSAPDRPTPPHSARGTCPESPGSYVARMQRTLLRMERGGSNANASANGNINVNGKANGNVNRNGTANSNANGQGDGQDCRAGSGPVVRPEGSSATGRTGTHAAESTEQDTKESHQHDLDEDHGDYHEMDLMIAAVSTMIGMHIPEEARYVLWVVCCAIIVLIPARRWGFFDPSLWSAPSSSPSPHLEVIVAAEGNSVAPSHGNASIIHRECGAGAAWGEPRHPGKVSEGTAGQQEAAGGATVGDIVKGTAAEAQEQQYASTKLYEEVSSPCRKLHVMRYITCGVMDGNNVGACCFFDTRWLTALDTCCEFGHEQILRDPRYGTTVTLQGTSNPQSRRYDNII